MTDKSDFRAIASLMGDALAQFSKLFQNEVDLAKAELGEKAQQVGVARRVDGGRSSAGHSCDHHGLACAFGGADERRLVPIRLPTWLRLRWRPSFAVMFIVIGLRKFEPGESRRRPRPSINSSATSERSRDSHDEPATR